MRLPVWYPKTTGCNSGNGVEFGINVVVLIPEYLVSTAETSVEARVNVSRRQTVEEPPKKTAKKQRYNRTKLDKVRDNSIDLQEKTY